MAEEEPEVPADGVDVSGAISNPTDAASDVYNAPTNISVSSMEQIFSPILIRRGRPAKAEDKISAFEVPTDTKQTCSVFGGDHIGPTRQELDPYFPNILGDDDDRTFLRNCDYQMINGQLRPENQGKEEPDLNQRKTSRFYDSVLVSHFRGPMILSGWGFDHADLPVPMFEITGEDSEQNDGANMSLQFDNSLVNNRGIWKSGPIDLKWDEQRKVWGAGHHILFGVADEDIDAPVNPCNPTYFKMKVLRREMPADMEFGNNLVSNYMFNEVVKITNRDPSLEQKLIKNMVFVVCTRVNYEWIPIWVGCPVGEDCNGGTGNFEDSEGKPISNRGDCFCFLSEEEEKELFSLSSAGDDCMDDDDDAPTPPSGGGGGGDDDGDEGGGGGGGGDDGGGGLGGG